MPPKPTKGPDPAYQELKKDLAAQTLGTLYILHGEEAYLRDYYLGRMRQVLIPEGMEGFNYHRLEGKQVTPQLIADLVDNLPMMSPRTLIEIVDYDIYKASEADRKTLVDLFEDLPEYCCLVFVYDILGFKSDARMKQLSAVLKAKGNVVNFQRQSQGDLTDWIYRRFKATGHSIDTNDAHYLIFLCGDLMHGLITEIDKISAYAKGTRITRGDIDAVAVPQLDAVVFQMTDALMEQNYDKAYEVLGDLLHMQESPIMILSVLGKHFRQLLSARIAFDQGKGADYLMGLWGMRSPYPAQKLMNGARRVSPGWCGRAVGRCAQTDLAMKSQVGADSQELLLNLLLTLSASEVRHATH